MITQTHKDIHLPDEVVRLSVLEGLSLVRAWREHPGLTQREVASRLGVSQSAYAQMERPGANLRHVILKKLAAAFGVKAEQLTD